jgi:hypothetical protein
VTTSNQEIKKGSTDASSFSRRCRFILECNCCRFSFIACTMMSLKLLFGYLGLEKFKTRIICFPPMVIFAELLHNCWLQINTFWPLVWSFCGAVRRDVLPWWMIHFISALRARTKTFSILTNFAIKRSKFVSKKIVNTKA